MWTGKDSEKFGANKEAGKFTPLMVGHHTLMGEAAATLVDLIISCFKIHFNLRNLQEFRKMALASKIIRVPEVCLRFPYANMWFRTASASTFLYPSTTRGRSFQKCSCLTDESDMLVSDAFDRALAIGPSMHVRSKHLRLLSEDLISPWSAARRNGATGRLEPVYNNYFTDTTIID